MKTNLKLIALCHLLSAICFSVYAQGTAFSYQGQLNNSGSPANGFYDIQFSLSSAPSGGGQVGSTVTELAVGVTNGLFSSSVDFGAVFTGSTTWLAISVRTNGVGGYVGLSPLQQLTPTPYAIYSANAGAVAATNIVGTLPAAQLPASVLTNGASGVTITGTFGGNGAGVTNVPGTLAQVVASGTSFAAKANTAYDLTNSAEVSVTLPPEANVGDLVQVTGTGTGGWQVTEAAVYWTDQTGSPTSGQWDSVASSSDGTHLVAVVDGGGIYTSADSGVT